MYRVLLADDEVHICQLIQHLVDWEALDAELCGVAHDGVEALELVRQLRPHIVISDIRMSGMDGISLLEKIRGAGMECAFILVSGYRQFDYAQKAIQLGVTDYLVKPIKKRELNAAIEKGLAELRQRGESQELGKRPESQESSAGRELETLARTIEAGGGKLDQLSLPALAQRCGVRFSGAACVIYGKFVCGETFPSDTLDLLYNRLHSGMRDTSWFDTTLFARYGDGFLMIGASDRPLPSLPFLQSRLQAILSVFAHWIVILGMSEPREGETFRETAGRARQAADQHYFHPGVTAFLAADSPLPQVPFEALAEGWSALPDAMQVLDAKTVRGLVQNGLQSLGAARSPEELFRYAGWVIDTMNHALSAFTAAQAGLEGLQYLHRNEILEQLCHCPSLISLSAKLCDILDEKIQSTRGMIEQMENKPVRIVRDMVARRYMEHISLNDAAEATGLNPVYLSVLFKKETGINFKDYVTNVRMDKAKEFLRQGEGISRVSQLVGYQDTKYFSRLFTQVVGVNPTQYKKLYQ